MELKDTGNRTVFETGSHKDLGEGRGRYDLIPLKALADLYRESNDEATAKFLQAIYNSMVVRDVDSKIYFLNKAINIYIKDNLLSELDKHVHNLAVLFEKGANKYKARDWELGRPMEVFINSALRHYFQYVNEETDEDHETAVIWNLLACVDTIRRMPSMSYTLNEIEDTSVLKENIESK